MKNQKHMNAKINMKKHSTLKAKLGAINKSTKIINNIETKMTILCQNKEKKISFPIQSFKIAKQIEKISHCQQTKKQNNKMKTKSNNKKNKKNKGKMC